MTEVQLLIADRDTAASNAATFERANPISASLATRAAAATVDDARAAAAAAAAAFPAWSALGPNERRKRLLRAADLLEARTQDFIALMMDEIGGHRRLGGLQRLSRSADAPRGRVHDHAGFRRNDSLRYPGQSRFFHSTAGGRRARHRPMECSRHPGSPRGRGSAGLRQHGHSQGFGDLPATHRLIGTVLREAGLDHGVINVLTHDPASASAIVGALIADPAVRRVNFTGSTRVGKMIAVTAAKYLKPILLELGGKAPLVILDDADLDAAVDAAAFGAFLNQGQICMSTERIIVDEKIADAFAQKFVAKVKNLPCGDPRKGEVVIGAVVGMATVDRVHALAQDAVSRGAKVLLQGDAHGTIMPAVIVDHVTPAMQIFRDESFGPSVSITRFKTVDEAIALANDTEYGLAAAVFGRDVARAFEVAKRIDSGICHINAPTVHDEAQMPFGGVKASGYGRFGGKAAIEQFTELRWITIQTTARHYPF